MTIDINKNSALIDPASSGYSGCGCGNRRYYTKAEIDEMLKDVLDPEQIEELINSIIEEYIESGELYDLIEQMFGEIYTKEEIDQILEDYATRNWARTFVGNEMAAETARTENTYLKDITITINGVEVHNNGEIEIEGGGTGGTIDISGKLDTSAFTQAMENETARTENTYAKKSEIPSLEGYATQNWVNNQGFLKDADISNKVDKSVFNSFTATTKQCCDFVKGEITDIWAIIATLTGGTPTPPIPPTPFCSHNDNENIPLTVKIVYNVKSTENATPLYNSVPSANPNHISLVEFSDGTSIVPSSTTRSFAYTFAETGDTTVVYTITSTTIAYKLFAGISDIVDVEIGGGFFDGQISGDYGQFSGCTSLTSVTITSENFWIPVYFCKGCVSLENISFDTCLYEIGSYAFSGCTALERLVLPPNLLSICDEAFKYCSSLSSIISYGSTTSPSGRPALASGVFTGVANRGTLYYPAECDYSFWLSSLPSGWVSEEI